MYEAADKSIYVSGYRDAENKPALTVRYWTAEQEGDLKFVYNEEKRYMIWMKVVQGRM